MLPGEFYKQLKNKGQNRPGSPICLEFSKGIHNNFIQMFKIPTGKKEPTPSIDEQAWDS